MRQAAATPPSKSPAISTGRHAKFREICSQDRVIVPPSSPEARRLPYLGLEDVESQSGRILRLATHAEAGEGASTTFAFNERHVLYGKLRPYLNKVALPDRAGRCTTEMIPLLPREGVNREFLAWALRRKETIHAVMQEKTGGRMPRADMSVLLDLTIALPPLAEQERIAKLLTKQMEAVYAARAAIEERLSAVVALHKAQLGKLFDSAVGREWPRMKLEAVADLLPAKSLATNGDAEVSTLTTACLTETGFDPAGIKMARMWRSDLDQCRVGKDEILVARSNTPELVGRVALYQGVPTNVVANDLTIRIRAREQMLPEFLATYLSALFLSGYWKEHAGGSSGTMKKITRTQLLALDVPVPDLKQQQTLVAKFQAVSLAARTAKTGLTAQLEAIDQLPASLLRFSFSEGRE